MQSGETASARQKVPNNMTARAIPVLKSPSFERFGCNIPTNSSQNEFQLLLTVRHNIRRKITLFQLILNKMCNQTSNVMHIIQPDGLSETSKITVDLIRLYQNIQALVTHGLCLQTGGELLNIPEASSTATIYIKTSEVTSRKLCWRTECSRSQ